MSKQNMYRGRAGQMVVMAEYLWRGWNVAIPEIDVGEDIFVVRDADGQLLRIQVKTATATKRRHGWSAQFSVGRIQLATPRTPDLDYVFVPRSEEGWGPPLLIRRSELYELHETNGVGTASEDTVVFYVSFGDGGDQAWAGKWQKGTDVTRFLEAWRRVPTIDHS